MFRRGLQPKTLLKNTLAALLTITLSGAYCLFCCQEIIAAAKQSHKPKAHVSQSENCHFSKTKSAESTKTTTVVNAFECCSLRFSFFVAKLEKKKFPQQIFVPVTDFFSFPESVKSLRTADSAAFRYRAPTLESRDLHIKNCVFRI